MKPKINKTELGGMLGERVSLRKVNNRLVVINRPKPAPRPLTAGQEAFQKRFKKAAKFAIGQVRDKVTEELYKTGITPSKRSAYLVALNDYLFPPTVSDIDSADYLGNAGDVISIDATDDFKVVRVRVIILDSDGRELERGEAIQYPKKDHIWKYTATVDNPNLSGSTVIATAFDNAENHTTLEKVL